jgi:hypothetical protein
MSEFVDARAIGQHCKRTRKTILTWARRGLIPCHRLGKRIVLFQLAEVADAIKQRGQGTEVKNVA